ncbi:MAG: HlyD family efflux transporter periplasmic adaptor subunit [Deltaproteobacteria bacterium]|nr:HlyD family efflux transporter periplasmic adaptor subunit [Deltaproteobacteria bacterium]
MKKKIVIIVLIIAVVAAAGTFAYKKFFTTPETRVLETGRVERGDIRGVLVGTGIIKSQVGAVVKIGARATGRVVKMHVKVGDSVTEGQLIAMIDDREILKGIEQQKAALQVATSTLAQITLTYPERIREAEANFTYARLVWEREKDLIKKEYTSKDSLEKAQSQFRAAEAVLKRLRDESVTQQKITEGTIGEIRAQLEQQEVRLTYTRIHSPITGIISDVTAQEGETIVAGLQVANLVTVLDPTRLEMWIYIDETDIGRAKPGLKCEYTVDTYPEQTFTGVITKIYPQPVVKENIVYYLSIVKVSAGDARYLRPEMTTHVKIVTTEKTGVLTVPNAAVKFEKGRQIAYKTVKGPKKVEKVELKLGIRGEERTEILSGVPEGTELATKLVLPAAPEGEAKTNADGKKQ